MKALATRLPLAIMAAAAAGLTALALLIGLQRQEALLIDRLVDERMEAALRFLESEGRSGVNLHYPHTGPLEWTVPARLRGFGPGRHLLAEGTQFEQILVRDIPRGRVVVSYLDALHQVRLQEARELHMVVFVLVTAVLWMVSRWWARELKNHAPVTVAPGFPQRTPRPSGLGLLDRLAQAYSPKVSEPQNPAVQDRDIDFIANVGHELRTPITMMATSCELLLESSTLTERERTTVRRMVGAVEHMKDSVECFMILAREGHFGSDDWVSLKDSVLEALAPHESRLAERGIQLEVGVSASALVYADRAALYVVVSNLIKNAVKYTDQGMIQVQCVNNTLHVSDSGCGIPDGDLPNIFLPFYRSRRAVESGREGLGLGLSLVQRVCDHYGWTISVRSTYGEGTHVSVNFSRPASLFA